ncbi:putative endo alpha-1,4-polygalactosaminidase [Calycina marina]|uniref:alpha-galactosidase n=1 Tax=Calycina marina TaxID=1763456 RepID=A0A9P7Z0Q9_9HELO|nr:putative endo alpha-1,4-polygalactosaminidase [Calycina marina]
MRSQTDNLGSKPQPRGVFHRSKKFWIILSVILIAIAIGLGVGLGVGLTQGSDSDSDSNPPSTTLVPTPNTTETYWQPKAGETWQIVLLNALKNTSLNVSVYDIDLFDNPTSTIDTLHAQNKKVICYFSAGSYEPNRPDSSQFTATDKGSELDGWPGEYWLQTDSSNVRQIMTSRLQLAKSKGCDGVDPDNVDGYDNENGLGLTTYSSVDYLGFLADNAHSLNLSIGLKNGGAIVDSVIQVMQWEVNEQCAQYNECPLFESFIEANKPVFQIEYPSGAPNVDASAKRSSCGNSSEQDFSTILKNMDLDEWLEEC